MKRKTLFFFVVAAIALCLLPLSENPGFCQTPTGNDPIIIIPEENELENGPRSPVYNPFTAFLLNNEVVLNCITSYGSVSVALTSTAGDNYSTVFDTEDGFIIIPISGLSGDYTLSLVDATGQRFVGEFEI